MSLVGYHGYKSPADLESMKDGLRPTEGGEGNHDPNWQGFYLAATARDAAGYAGNGEGNGAGGVVRVTLPDGVTVQTVDKKDVNVTGDGDHDSEQLRKLKEKLGIGPDEQLMEALGSRNTVLQVTVPGEGGTRAVEETIVPWQIAEHATVEQVIGFDDSMRGAAAAADYVATGTRPSDRDAPFWDLADIAGTDHLSPPAAPPAPQPADGEASGSTADAGHPYSHDEL
ncbi:hypothetical protein OG965_38040 [Streptomyces sp. NBC_00224]|uniref:Diphtheria toxin catalytic domain-containing protein n=2 Tax=Streptomyces TaxID=1883 RepID=A0AAU2GUG7_9ACTN